MGSPATKKQISDIATDLEGRGYKIEGGGGRAAEEYLPGPGGRIKGSSFVDITASHPKYGLLRINSVDRTKSGLKATRELKNAAGLTYKGTRIRVLKNATKDGLDQLEGKVLKSHGGHTSGKTLNIRNAPNQ